MYGNLMDIDVRQGGLRDGCRGLASLDGLASVFLSFLPPFFLGWALHCIARAARCSVRRRTACSMPPLSYCNDAMHLFMR